MSDINEKCVICGMIKGQHRNWDCAPADRGACPGAITGENPPYWPAVRENPKCPKCSNSLMPVEYPSNAMLNREQWESVRAGDWFCSRCKSGDNKRPLYFWKKDFEAKTQSTCPPGCAPFDLPKALAGARLVTRDGRQVINFSKRNVLPAVTEFLYEAVISGEWQIFSNQGRFYSDNDHMLDLFLAAKEEVSEELCALCNFSIENHSFKLRCPLPEKRCDPVWHKTNKFTSPPPETEARRQAQEKLHAIHAEMAAREEAFGELDRQIEVMRASKKAGAVVERLPWIHHPDGNWIPIEKREGIFPFDWQNFNHRIRPTSPAPPRRVWITWNDDGKTLLEAFTRRPTGELTKAVSEMIELTPEVRAKLGMGGEK